MGETRRELLFFGGKDYVPLFCKLSQEVKGTRKVFHRAEEGPSAPDCVLVKFVTMIRTNWHYDAANAFLLDSSLDV